MTGLQELDRVDLKTMTDFQKLDHVDFKTLTDFTGAWSCLY